MAHTADEPSAIFGMLAEFDTPEALVAAARSTEKAGYTSYDAYTPFPIEDLEDAVPRTGPYVGLLVLVGGLSGVLLGFLMEVYLAGEYYPMNIGGRPLLSWPSFIPVAYECGILLAAFSAVFGMIALNGLPMPYHPVFNVDRFELASQDKFFLAIESDDPKYDAVGTTQFLQGLGAAAVTPIPR